MNSVFDATYQIAGYDDELWEAIVQEYHRQADHIELIASENYASPRVLAAQGTILTNKYAEGYPGHRYYGGCQYVDKVEQLAIERLQALYQVAYANVQPHSGSQANAAAYMALLQPGDVVLSMSLSAGGHLTHGSAVNFSGRLYRFVHYGVDANGLVDYEQVRALALQYQPRLIVAGFSAYTRLLDWQVFRDIVDIVGAYLLVDMAHVAGLIAADVYPSPVPYADIITSTTHKTLRGPRGGFIICPRHSDLSQSVAKQVFPGLQGGPLMHVIAAKAVAFKEAQQAEFRQYQQQVIQNARSMAEQFMARGFKVVGGGTDCHMVLLDLSPHGLTGKQADECLDKAHITVNKNMVPGDKQSPQITSGIRLGTAAITTRGFKEQETKVLTHWICDILEQIENPMLAVTIKERVISLCKAFPVYQLDYYS